MKKVTLKLVDPMGFHARPVAAAVNKLREYGCEGSIFHDGREVDMTSVVKLVELGIPTASKFILAVNGKREDEAVLAIVDELTDLNFVEEA